MDSVVCSFRIVMVIGAVLTIGVVFIFSYFYRAFGTRSHFYINEKMNSSRGDGLGGAGIVMTPKSGSYENVVIWMHGLGDTADGWAQAMPDFTVSNTKFVLPTAPNRPISLNGGMKMPGWSDIHGLDVSSAEDKAGFEESRARIEKLIATEIAAGILPLKIVVGGFSQGGALALHTAMRSSVRLGGCVALSTWLPFRDEYPEAKSAAATDIKIFQVHGTADSVVRFPWGKSSHDLLAAMCAEPPRFMSIDGMGHSSHPREMAAVDQFLNAILS